MFDTITLLTDFGLQDDFVGVCRGVIRRIAPDAVVIDVTHGIAPQAVTQGALVLARSVPFLPPGVHLAVVDPGVGSDRRGVAMQTGGGRVFVGPDNGLLTLAADREGILEVRALTNPRYHLQPVSRTFHARDVFAPVAAHVAAGVLFADLGDAVDAATLVRVVLPEPSLNAGTLRATVVDVDRFGNLGLNVRAEHLRGLGLAPGGRAELRFAVDAYYAAVAETYADALRGDLVLYEDSYGAYAVAINGGNAAALIEARVGDELTLAPL